METTASKVYPTKEVSQAMDPQCVTNMMDDSTSGIWRDLTSIDPM